jgi:hypothetical protein
MFNRGNPSGGWGNERLVNQPAADFVNKERLAWENNYLLLKTQGRGNFPFCAETQRLPEQLCFHLENPVRFEKEIKVTIEHEYGASLANRMSLLTC